MLVLTRIATWNFCRPGFFSFHRVSARPSAGGSTEAISSKPGLRNSVTTTGSLSFAPTSRRTRSMRSGRLFSAATRMMSS